MFLITVESTYSDDLESQIVYMEDTSTRLFHVTEQLDEPPTHDITVSEMHQLLNNANIRPPFAEDVPDDNIIQTRLPVDQDEHTLNARMILQVANESTSTGVIRTEETVKTHYIPDERQLVQPFVENITHWSTHSRLSGALLCWRCALRNFRSYKLRGNGGCVQIKCGVLGMGRGLYSE